MIIRSLVLGALLMACGGNEAAARPPVTSAGETPSAGGKVTPTSGGEEALGDLELKRMTDQIKAEIGKHKARFKELCGGDVELDIDWASFGRDKTALETFSGNYGLERLVAGFEGVCHDKAGKDAVRAKVKKIRAVNIKDASKVKAGISGGVFTAELAWSTGGAPGMNESELGAAITKGL